MEAKHRAPPFRRPHIAALTIQRQGRARWKVTGEHHCGPREYLERVDGYWGVAPLDIMPVDWTIRCRCAPVLDQRGFLFDQANVAAFIDRLAERGTDMSCEQLAQHVALLFLDKLARDAQHCQVLNLRVILSPAPHMASVEAEYSNE